MSNFQEIIYQGILSLGKQMDASQIIDKFGRRIIDLNDFTLLVRSFNQSLSQMDIDKFYMDVLREFRAQGITTYVMNELIRRASKLQAGKFEKQQRSAFEIMTQIQKTIQKKNQQIDRVFRIFDFDKDCMLKESEFKCFVEYYIPTISPEEYKKLRETYKSQNVTVYELMQWMQEGTSMRNSIKMQKKDLQPEKQIRLVPPPQIPIKQQQPIKRMNPVLESILYEDPNQANILKSDIQFQNYIILDYNLSGVQDFLTNFHKLFPSKQKYIDQQFPPNGKSLGPQLQNYDWKRLDEIWGVNNQIFVKDITQSRFGLGKWISPKDIKQGELGDCYFLSALSSMACRWPDLLLDLFLTQKTNICGIYAIRLCIDGVWQAILLDDHIPTKQGQPVFSQSSTQESWVILMEKAWAKAFGSYSNIISGESREVIKSLTGGPTWVLNTNQNDFEAQFNGCIYRKCLMTVGTFTEGKNYDYLGLLAGHAYSILKKRQIKHKDKGDVTLVKLRNPWGKVEWKGDWSDDSYLWTQELREQLRIGKKTDDGIFYMDLKDLMTYFQTIYVGYFQKDYKYQSMTLVNKKNNSLYFNFDVLKEGEYYITIHQQSSRHFKDKYMNYQYSPIRVLLGYQGKQSYKYEDSKHEKQYDANVGGLLQKGRYTIQVKIKWLFWQEHEFTISLYGEQSLKLRQIQKEPNFLQQCYLDKARQNENKKGLSADCPQVLTCQQFTIEQGIGYIYYHNQSNKILDFSCNFTKMNGLKLKKPERGSSYEFQLGSNQEKLILLKIDAEGFGMAQQMSYILK